MQTHGLIWAGLFVQDLEAAIPFYRQTLGLPLRKRGEDWAFFDAGQGAQFELFTGGVASAEPKGPDKQSVVVSLRVDDLDQAMQELQGKGITFVGEVGEFDGTRWAYFFDPEGNRLELKEI